MTETTGIPVVLKTDNGVETPVREFLGQMLDSGAVDALIMPLKVPSGDSFAWILLNDAGMLDDAVPFPAVMPVQGARALRSLTRKEKGDLTVLALMRPCEIRAGIELSKLGQVNTDNLILATYDCPGAIPLQDYVNDPESSEASFKEMFTTGEPGENAKPACRTCVNFSAVDSDLHFGFLGISDEGMLVIPGSTRGAELLQKMDIQSETGDKLLPLWKSEVESILKKRTAARDIAFKKTESDIKGFSGMLNVFSNCIGCHNCQSACPICYCRLCYFGSEASRSNPEALMNQAIKRGGISLPPERIMFHTGRLAHMSLSCVSCGQCSDACPVSIPVADVFSFVAEQTQSTFEYKAGRNDGKPLPLRDFKKSELPGVHELVKDAEPGGASHE
ncbi:MAG: 4Fe-4S dicluster domain-containing protein [Candidatus Sabulitectum sp.]|nr:4Fe-4S dicluster domain-containing protein [Candidatus Sabulitectum sp.]